MRLLIFSLMTQLLFQQLQRLENAALVTHGQAEGFEPVEEGTGNALVLMHCMRRAEIAANSLDSYCLEVYLCVGD